MNLGTTRNDMARAVLEAIALEVKNNLDILEGYAGNIRRIYIGGGLTKFHAFNQMQADVYQKTLIRNSENAEQTALGAWVGATVALNLYPDYDTALEKVAVQREIFAANQFQADLYREKQRKMNELYLRIYSDTF